MADTEKMAYICGPLTDLPEEMREPTKRLYEAIADVCEGVFGVRAFVPHEHFDPILHANYEPHEVDAAERKQICEKTSHLIVVPLIGSWGGGIEVEMARESGVPVILVYPLGKKVSRLLRGNPAVVWTILYGTEDEALLALKNELLSMSLVVT